MCAIREFCQSSVTFKFSFEEYFCEAAVSGFQAKHESEMSNIIVYIWWTLQFVDTIGTIEISFRGLDVSPFLESFFKDFYWLGYINLSAEGLLKSLFAI